VSGINGNRSAHIISSQKSASCITSTGTGGALFITSDTSLRSSLLLDNITFRNDGSRAFANIGSDLPNTSSFVVLDVAILGFDTGTVFKNIQVVFGNFMIWITSGRIDLIDIVFRSDFSVGLNFSDTNDTAFNVITSDVSLPTIIQVINSSFSSHPGESSFFIHSNLSESSSLTFTGVQNNRFTSGTGSFFGSKTGTVTAMADAGGGRCTGHGNRA